MKWTNSKSKRNLPRVELDEIPNRNVAIRTNKKKLLNREMNKMNIKWIEWNIKEYK